MKTKIVLLGENHTSTLGMKTLKNYLVEHNDPLDDKIMGTRAGLIEMRPDIMQLRRQEGTIEKVKIEEKLKAIHQEDTQKRKNYFVKELSCLPHDDVIAIDISPKDLIDRINERYEKVDSFDKRLSLPAVMHTRESEDELRRLYNQNLEIRNIYMAKEIIKIAKNKSVVVLCGVNHFGEELGESELKKLLRKLLKENDLEGMIELRYHDLTRKETENSQMSPPSASEVRENPMMCGQKAKVLPSSKSAISDRELSSVRGVFKSLSK